ncbi:KCNKG protein, partial [Polyodon spathula]|nr:KCNKG protein [Polyodon spathula]
MRATGNETWEPLLNPPPPIRLQWRNSPDYHLLFLEPPDLELIPIVRSNQFISNEIKPEYSGSLFDNLHKSQCDLPSFLSSTDVVESPGYGNLSPSTVSGQVFCVFYALFGIPLNLAFLNQLGKGLTAHLGRLERSVLTTGQHGQILKMLTVSFFLILGTLLFLVFPPVIFSYVEGWTYGEGFYYAFITLSTIGFGDYVVGTDPEKHYISVYRSLAGVWIIFGLAWLAMLCNLGAGLMDRLLQLKQSWRKSCRAGPQEESKDGDVLDQRAMQSPI